MMLYPVKGNGRPNTSYGYLQDTKMSRYLRLNEHMNKTVEAGLFPEDFEDSSQGEKFIQIMRQKGKPAKVFSSMANVYSNKKSQKLSAVKRMNRMLNAGIVTAKDGDFDKVDNFLLNGVLNAVGRPGGKASNEKIVSKILCHDKIRHIGTEWINKQRREAELSRKRVLKAYACRFRSRIGQSPLARYQRSMYGFLRSPTLEARLNAEVGVATDVQIMEEHMGNDVVTPGGEVVEGVPESLKVVGENNEDAHWKMAAMQKKIVRMNQ